MLAFQHHVQLWCQYESKMAFPKRNTSTFTTINCMIIIVRLIPDCRFDIATRQYTCRNEKELLDHHDQPSQATHKDIASLC